MSSTAEKHTSLSSPCRLHFGMFALSGQDRSYGGLGVMIAEPRIEVTVTESDGLLCTGVHQERVIEFVRKWHKNQTRFPGTLASAGGQSPRNAIAENVEALPCQVNVNAPAQHVGLGVGTQMALAIGAALYAHFDLPQPNISELALSLGRGRRSAVGSFGFALGGLIVDGGCEANSAFPELAGHFSIPEDWRFVLVQPQLDHTLYGNSEINAFERLPDVSDETRDRLASIAQNQLVPALVETDFDRFANSVGQFNRVSGSLFAAVQGGPYHGKKLERMVGEFARAGFSGVGQSSWGPTLFVLAENEQQAGQAADLARELIESLGGDVTITRPDNVGFHLENSLAKVGIAEAEDSRLVEDRS